jgi:hypothetical protein
VLLVWSLLSAQNTADSCGYQECVGNIQFDV